MEEEKCEMVNQSMHVLNDDIWGEFLASDEFSLISYFESERPGNMLPDHREGGAFKTNVSTTHHTNATMDSGT
jgi:hypothetical protein